MAFCSKNQEELAPSESDSLTATPPHYCYDDHQTGRNSRRNEHLQHWRYRNTEKTRADGSTKVKKRKNPVWRVAGPRYKRSDPKWPTGSGQTQNGRQGEVRPKMADCGPLALASKWRERFVFWSLAGSKLKKNTSFWRERAKEQKRWFFRRFVPSHGFNNRTDIANAKIHMYKVHPPHNKYRL